MNSLAIKSIMTVLLFLGTGLAASMAKEEVLVTQNRSEQRMERQERRGDQRSYTKKSRRHAEQRSQQYQKRLKKHRQRIDRHKHRPRYGTVLKTLPRGYRRAHSKHHHDHYYFGGAYYRYRDHGYHVVRPPYGLIMATLPLGYVTLQFGTEFYARYNDVYYRPVPQGYMVVEPPAAAPPPPQPNIAAEPANSLGSVTVNIEVLNVRSGPSRLHPVVDHVYSGDQLYVLGQAPRWHYVRLPQGGYGWVWAEFAVGYIRP